MSHLKCPKCGKANDDNWPITVGDRCLDGGCQECWEEECDKAWWEAMKSLNALQSKGNSKESK